MKFIILFLVFASLSSGYAFGQNSSNGTAVKVLYVVLVPDRKPLITENLIIAAQDIDSGYEMPFNQCVEIRKLTHTSTIWVIKPKKAKVFLTLNQLIIHFKIDPKYITLPVRIDNWETDNPEALLAEQDEVKDVQVIKINDENSFINIITFHPLTKHIKQEGEITLH